VAGLGRGVTGFVTRSDIGPGTYAMGDGVILFANILKKMFN
jgi:hypothetical protein